MDLDRRPRLRRHRGRPRAGPRHRRRAGRRGRPRGALRPLPGVARRGGGGARLRRRSQWSADNADPETPARLIDCRSVAVGSSRRGTDLASAARRRGGVSGSGPSPTRLGRRVRSRSSSAPSGWPGSCPRRSPTAARSPSCSRRRSASRCPTWRSPTRCGPGWPGWRRPWPTSSGRAGSGSTRCCPDGSAPSGSASSTRPRVTPRLPGGRGAHDPAGPLRRAGGVRPGGGLPALARGVVRQRRDAAGRRRDDAGHLELLACSRFSRSICAFAASAWSRAFDLGRGFFWTRTRRSPRGPFRHSS